MEAVNRGRAEVCMKGKNRIVILPRSLVIKLKDFARKRAIKKGSIFCSRNGRPLDRSNICHEMKKNCGEAGVEESKVFPIISDICSPGVFTRLSGICPIWRIFSDTLPSKPPGSMWRPAYAIMNM